MQLVAYGAQDIYLTGNPQITFFKVVYRRHTNFSMEAIQQTFNGNITDSASSVTCTISRNGDLVHKMWLDVKMAADVQVPSNVSLGGGQLDPYCNWINNTGCAFIKDVELEIGGQRIDKHYSRWLDIWNTLTDSEEKEWPGLNKSHDATHIARRRDLSEGGFLPQLQLYIPLQFWFCRNPGLALPLIALQYHEVKVKLNTRGIAGLIALNAASSTHSSLDSSNPEVNLYCDYIYLDTDERRRFAQVSHEYLIEQVQQQESTTAANLKLNFNHPVKELIWVFQNSAVGTESTTRDSTNIDIVRNYFSPADVTFQGTGDGTGSVDDLADLTRAHLSGRAYRLDTENNDYFNYNAGAGYTLSHSLAAGTNGVVGDPTTNATTRTGNRVEVVNDNTKNIESFATAKLQLNGHDRFSKRRASYFRTVQPAQHHSVVPHQHIYCYSFALKPEEHQPSGTCNFSRIDNAQFIFEDAAIENMSKTFVYAVNYNVLRIMSGMGGLAYSN